MSLDGHGSLGSQAQGDAEMRARTEAIAHIGSWRMAIDSGEVDWSDEAYRIYGIDRATFRGDLNEVVRTAVHPDDVERFVDSASAASEGRISPLGAYRIVRPDGTVRWIQGGAEKVLDESGAVVALQGYMQDVTDRKMAELSVQERERAMAALLDAITESALLVRPDGEIVAINETAVTRLGHDRPVVELVGSNVFDLLDAETAETRRGFMEQVVATGKPARFEDVRFGRRILNSVRPVGDVGGVPQLALFGYDITEFDETLSALRESEHWLTESQRIARLGHYVYDIPADNWIGSKVLYEVLGVSEDYKRDFAGWLGVVHPEDTDRLAHYFQDDVVGNRVPFDIEYRIVRPCDGAERWVHGLGKVDFADDGAALAMFGTIQDITERKRVENELGREQALLLQAESIGGVGSWQVDMTDSSHRWSSQAIAILGFDPAATYPSMRLALDGAVHPDDLQRFSVWHDAIMDGRSMGSLDFRILRPDSEERWVCMHGELQVDEAGVPVAVAGIVQDITGRKQAEEIRVVNLEEAANVDRLTGLKNRRGFDLAADQAVAQALRAGQGIGLMYFDVDGMKAINDEFGHAQGDRALQDLASIMRFTLRSADAVARIGGDEFVVLTVGGEQEALDRLAQRLDEGLDFFNATNDRPYRLSASCGKTWCPAVEPCDLKEQMALADTRMYEEKQRRQARET
jgi:diguanylate cyclase (GGDEF)-like protein/PAS domain S-box-containing protein